MKYRSCWPIFTLRSKFGSHYLILWKYDTHASNSLGDIRQSHWTMKYRSHRPTFILRSNVRSYWPLIPKYDIYTSNSLQDITHNHSKDENYIRLGKNAGVIKKTAACKVQVGIIQNIYIQELWFLRAACRPVLLNIYMKISWTFFK